MIAVRAAGGTSRSRVKSVRCLIIRIDMKKIGLGYLTLFSAAVLAAVSAVSCSRDGASSVPDGDSDVVFGGAVRKTGPATKAGDFNEDDFIMINSSSSAVFGDISICSHVDGSEDVISVYEAADGVEGRLAVKSGSQPLIWNGLDAGHTFYAWTFPSGESGGVDMSDTDLTQGTVTFGTGRDTGLEQFIVAEEGPVSYQDNGSYVRLLFYRPVAKIRLESLTHIDANGSRTQIEQCSILFPNLPRTSVFDAMKERVDGGNYGDVWLVSGDTGYVEPENGLLWKWDVTSGNSVADSELFLHPFEFGTDPGAADGDQPDETQPGYFIVTAEIDGVEKTYFASLAGMIDVTELQAGQFMRMQLSVQDGAAGGIGCQIVDWNTETETDVIHRRPGVYSAEDAASLLQILSSDPVDLDALDRFCTGGNVIHLYTEVDWSSVTGTLTIPDGYTLDAQGYAVILGSGGSLAGDVTGLAG